MAHGKENGGADDGGYRIQRICRGLQSGHVLASRRDKTQSNHARVIQVSPCLGTRVLVIHEAEHAKVINERAIGQHDVDVEPEAFEDLHLGDDDGVFEVVERVAKVRHGCVFELVRGLACHGRRERVRVALEKEVADVDEVSHSERTLFEFRGEIECAHAHFLSAEGFCEDQRRRREGRAVPDPYAELLHRGRIPETLVQDLGGSNRHLLSGTSGVLWVGGRRVVWTRTV